MRFWKNVFIVLLVTMIQNGTDGTKSILLTKFVMCDPEYNYPIKFEASFKLHEGVQYVNMTAFVDTPLGQDQSMNVTFEYSPTGEGYVSLFKFSRSNLCYFFNKDLGPFWFELQKQIAVRSRSCPMPVGRYNVQDYQLPFTKLPMPLPSGFIRSVMNIVENKSNRMISCLFTLAEITN